MMELKRITGQCAPLFFMALIFDLVGFLVLVVGLAGSVKLEGRYYGDFLALTGAVIMFFGIGFWVMWYSGNLGAGGKPFGLRRISRKLTESLSSVRTSLRSSMRSTARTSVCTSEKGDIEKVDEEEMDEKEQMKEQMKEEMKEQEVDEKKEMMEEQEDMKDKEEMKEKLEGEEKKDEGSSEKNEGYINEAYEPTENETI